MAITATIQSVGKVGDGMIAVQYQLSDGSINEMQFNIDIEKSDIRQAIKNEVARLNTLEAKIASFASDLVGRVF